MCTMNQLKDKQHRVAADSQYSRLSLTYFWSTWIEMYTIISQIANVSMYLFM